MGRSEAAALLGLSPGRLRYWQRIGLVRPSFQDGRAGYYDFHDLICLKTAQGLVDKGLAASRIKGEIQALRERFPAFEGQLSTKRIYVFENRIIISDRRRLLYTHAGQLLFKFDVNDFRREMDARLSAGEQRSAVEWLREGLALESQPNTWKRALKAYQAAVKEDPTLSEAYVRMGSIYIAQRKFVDAQRCFRMALRRNPYHSEACFKLGNVLDELNCTEEALRWYEKAVEAEPDFSSAYFNLAAVAEKLGLLDRAVRAWRAYLQFEPTGSQASQVRRRIDELEQLLAGQA